MLGAKICRQLFEVVDPRCNTHPRGNLLQRPVGNAGVLGDCRPLPFARIQLVDNEVMNGWHGTEYKPELGPVQAGLGLRPRLRYLRMGKPLDTSLEKAVDGLLDIVASNLKAAIGATPVTTVARESGVSKGSIQRILGGSKGYANQAKTAAQIDTLLRLAWHFRVPFQSLFADTDRTAVVLGKSAHAYDIQRPDLERRSRRHHPDPDLAHQTIKR